MSSRSLGSFYFCIVKRQSRKVLSSVLFFLCLTIVVWPVIWPVACDLWPVACNLWPVTCTLAPQRSTSNFYALIGQMKPVYFDSWSWKSFVSTCDALNCLSLRDGQNGQNEIQLPSRVFCYSWLVCLLGFWFRNTSLVKVGNPISDGIVFVFHLAWCVRRLKSLKRF